MLGMESPDKTVPMQFILFPSSCLDSHQNRCGSKAATLAQLPTLAPIPSWFVVLPTAAQAQGTLHPAAQAELAIALQRLCPQGELVAVRSSALAEDGIAASFAGQYDSFLGITPADVPAHIAAVWQSAHSDRLQTYIAHRGRSLPPEPDRPACPDLPAVIVQHFVNAEVAGVAFSAHPVTGQRGIAVVSGLYGLGSAIVSGEQVADTFQVNRDGQISDRHIADKPSALRWQNDQIATVPVPSPACSQPCLSDEQVLTLARLSRQAARHFSRPAEIEWAIAHQQIYLLQARPITALSERPDPDAPLTLWDNSNIIESYSGVTTPLTFSFARRAYENVYRQFCRMMGVSEKAIAQHDRTFRRMIGLIRGRIYYNLLSWYRILALLPGFQVNRRFMEQMMGVKEPLPDDILTQLSHATWSDRLRDSLHLLRTSLSLLWNYHRLPHHIRHFYRRLDTALALPHTDLAALRPDELATYYQQVEQQLLTRWDAPLINDFFAMVFYGLLRSLCQNWCDDQNGMLQNALLSQTGDIISSEPVQRMRQMAILAAAHPDFVTQLCQAPLPELETAIAALPAFAAQYHAYLNTFGDRCLGELKLESPTLLDDPLPLLRTIGHLVHHPASPAPAPPTSLKHHPSLRSHPLRRHVLNWVLHQARQRVRDRENLRFERTRVFGRARQLFRELGRQFYALDVIHHADDIFYLDLAEILSFIDGTAITTDLKAAIAQRRTEFEHYRHSPAPSDRFSTLGIVYHGNTYERDRPFLSPSRSSSATSPDNQNPGNQNTETRQGIGCSPGQVRGPIQRITDPSHTTLRPGHILVAPHTDPGWIVLFPLAQGLLVERGSVLSHSAIVSRELNLPAIVSIPHLMDWLQDGDWVEFDGQTGWVRRITSPILLETQNDPLHSSQSI